jgi:hypothetical protein
MASALRAPIAERRSAARYSDDGVLGQGVGLKNALANDLKPPARYEAPAGSLGADVALIAIRCDIQQRKGAENVRRIGRRRRMQIGLIELAEAGHAEQAQRARDLVLHEFEHAHDAGLPRRGERIALHAAEPDEMGAERHCLDDVAAAAKTAVDDDRGASGDRLDDFRQNIHGTAAVIELAAAVIGDVDDFDAVIERDFGVLRGRDAFDGERNFFEPLLMRSTVRQSSAAWNWRPWARRRPAVKWRLAISRSRRL